MKPMQKPKRPRPRLTLPIVLYGLIDAVGMLLLATGGIYFRSGPGSVFPNFPSTTAEAAVTMAVGGVLMFWAAARVLREILKQPHMLRQDDDIA